MLSQVKSTSKGNPERNSFVLSCLPQALRSWLARGRGSSCRRQSPLQRQRATAAWRYTRVPQAHNWTKTQRSHQSLTHSVFKFSLLCPACHLSSARLLYPNTLVSPNSSTHRATMWPHSQLGGSRVHRSHSNSLNLSVPACFLHFLFVWCQGRLFVVMLNWRPFWSPGPKALKTGGSSI